VDAVVFCTGYLYHLRFLLPSCRVFFHPNLARRALLQATADGDSSEIDVEGRSVWPLYEHVLHVEHPSLAFIGLNWKVLPFACFEAQARFVLSLMRHPRFLEWDANPDLDSHINDHPPHGHCASSTTDSSSIAGEDSPAASGEQDSQFPSTKRAMMEWMWARWDASERTASDRGPQGQQQPNEEEEERVKQHHMLGSQQWAYYRHLERLSYQAEASARLVCGGGHQTTQTHAREWRCVQAVYEDVGHARLQSPDTYRRRQYTLSPTDALA
jgi:hypothetical protein